MFNSNSCVICGDSITDPVCRNCYVKETEILLNELKVNSIANEIILDKIKDKLPIESLNDAGCVLCRKENVTFCRYCFSVNLIKILRELNFTEDLIKNFEYEPVCKEYENIFLEDEKILDDEILFENLLEVRYCG